MKREPAKASDCSLAWRVPWWRSCASCGLDFRWEPAWKGLWRIDQYPIYWHRRFVCLSCAPIPEEARPFFGVDRPKKPDIPCPPPPPARKP